MRKSVASHATAAGANAAAMLGHSDPRVTLASYIDPRVATPPQASDVLFSLANREKKGINPFDSPRN